jgi:creatinine amidohydrolase
MMNKAEKGLIPDSLSKKELSKLGKKANKSFISVTKNGVWGDPTRATQKDGEMILKEIISNLVKESQTCLTGIGRKFHQ